MTTIWLVYEANNITRNQFFIDRWHQAANSRRVQIHLVTTSQLTWGIKDHQTWLAHTEGLTLPDACVMRLNHPLLSTHLESMGIPCYNNARIAHICNDKRLTHQLVAPLAPAMDTVFLQDETQPLPFPYPVVVKDALSCGGKGVWLAHNQKELQSALVNIPKGQALAQAMCDTPGKDVRAYVMGGKIISMMQRMSRYDFRSNIGQGGTAQPYTLTDDETAMALRIASLFDIGLVGIDFIFHQGRLVFNEIEDAVGTRMLYEQGKIDVVQMYLDLILSRL